MGDIGKRRRRIEVLPVEEPLLPAPAPEPGQPQPAPEPEGTPEPAR
jgi:hypothetical protein